MYKLYIISYNLFMHLYKLYVVYPKTPIKIKSGIISKNNKYCMMNITYI